MSKEGQYLTVESKIVEALKEVYDPEIPVNVYDLGLIYNIELDDNNNAEIRMTLTAPNCPIADDILQEVHDTVKEIDEINEVKIDLVFDPPWDKDMMSEEAKLELGLL